MPGPRSASQASLREANLALVTRVALGADQPLSRADLAVRTDLTRSTVSRLVDELVEGGLLHEVERAPSGGRGRPATPLAPAPGAVVALGLQVNAGYLAGVVRDLGGAVLAREVVPVDLVGSSPRPTLDRLATLGRRLLRHNGTARLAGVGVALPGLVGTTGRLALAPNLGWQDVDVVGLLSRRMGTTVVAANEADLAALALAHERPGRPSGLTDFLHVSGEIGIGGAVVVGGRVQGGPRGWAGEVGHVCVDPSGPHCRCGSTGCLETYAGLVAVATAAGLPLDTGAADLARLAAETRRRTVGEALERAGWALGVALAGVVNVVDVPTVVLGGHLAVLAPHLVPVAEPVLRQRVLSSRWQEPRLVAGPVDPALAASGAALARLEDVVDDPAAHLAG